VADDEMFKVMRTDSKKNKAWKRVVTKCTFIGDNYMRKAPKYERFIRPTGLRMKRANVTHPELKASFQLDILGVKKNPSSNLYTNLGVLTKGMIIEVNVSDLGLVTTIGGRLSEVHIRYLSSFSWFGIFLFNSFNYSKRVITKQLTKAIDYLSHHLINSFGSYVIGLGVF
jgi:ribosomal protein S8E